MKKIFNQENKLLFFADTKEEFDFRTYKCLK